MSTTEDDLFLMRLLEAWEAHARIIQERANQLYSWTSNTTRRLEQKHLARETVESSRNHLLDRGDCSPSAPGLLTATVSAEPFARPQPMKSARRGAPESTG